MYEKKKKLDYLSINKNYKTIVFRNLESCDFHHLPIFITLGHVMTLIG